MGSWSVYCGISNIAITSGNKCVLLPLKKTEAGEYLPLLPSTLPIFGTYDDYGGLEDIEEDDNTKLIEEHFNCSIHDFCQRFTRGCIDSGDVEEHLMKNEEIKNWKFMFIDRQVYDFLITTKKSDGGNLDFGKKEILTLLGFKYNGINNENTCFDPKRFNKEWEYQDQLFYSDGTWLHTSTGEAIYYFNDTTWSKVLKSYIDIPEDKMWIGEKTTPQMWRYTSEEFLKRELFYIIGIDYYELAYRGIKGKYISNLEKFGDIMADLITLRRNIHSMSGYFVPYVLYLTPQCGEYEDHQLLLDKFAEINKSYVREREE